jgi:PKD repeat protein
VSDTIHIVVSNVRQTPSSTFQKFFGCENDTVSISAPSWYATTKFKWNTGDTLQTIAVTDSGFYYATLTDKGCSYTDSVQVIKLPYPIYTPLTDTSICPNSSVILKPNAVNYDSIKWNAKTVSDSIIISAASNPFYTIYKSYIITNNNKLVCKISDTLQVTILAIQGLELGNNQNACAGDSLRLMPNHIYNTYLWNTNETSADIYVKNTGMYTLWVKDMNGCDEKDSIYTNFYIKPDGSYSYQISQGFNVAFMPVYNSYAQYQWQFGDGVNSMLVSPSHIYASSGNYRSSLVVSDSNNCIDSSAQYIFFSGINSLSVAANKLLAFPNPFSNQITISGNIPNGLVLVEWFDSWGRKIYQTYKTASLGNLNIYAPEQLNSGVSFIKISTESWQGSVLVLKE